MRAVSCCRATSRRNGGARKSFKRERKNTPSPCVSGERVGVRGKILVDDVSASCSGLISVDTSIGDDTPREEKSMSQHRRRFDTSFKLKVVQMVRAQG